MDKAARGRSTGPGILVLSYLALYLLWGANPFFIKKAVATIPVEWVLAVRFTLAGIAFLVLRRRSLRSAVWSWKRAGAVVLMSVLLLGIGNSMAMLAQRSLSSYAASLMAALIPFYVAVYDRVLFGVRIPAAAKFGIALGVAGAGLLLYDGRDLWGSLAAPGNLFLLASNLSWSLGLSLGKKLPLFDDGILNAGLEMLLCGLLALAYALVRNPDVAALAAGISASSLVGLAYITALGGTAFAVFNWLVPREPSVRLATYTLVNPVIAVIIGLWAGREKATPFLAPAVAATLSAVACIVYGKAIAERLRSGRRPPRSGP